MFKYKHEKYLLKNKKLKGGGYISFDITTIKNVDILDIDVIIERGNKYQRKIYITTLLNEKITFEYEKELSCGSHGCVFLYKLLDNENIKIVCKYPRRNGDLDDDIKVINLLKFCSEYYIPSHIYNTQFILMKYMDGDLSDFFKKNQNCNSSIIIKIMKFLIDSVNCLYSNGLCYTDMKKQNILYKLEDDKLNLLLGDLGSITEIGNEGLATYPSPYMYDHDKKEYIKCVNCGFFKAIESDIVWSLGITFLSFLENYSINMKNYHWQFIGKLKDNFIEENVIKDTEIFCDYFFKDKHDEPYIINHFKTILKRMLVINPIYRISLKNLKELFDFHFDETPKFLGA